MLNLQSLSSSLHRLNSEDLKGLLKNTAEAVYLDPMIEGPDVLRENLPKILSNSSLLEITNWSYFEVLEAAFDEMQDEDFTVSEETVEALFWFYDQI